MKIKIAMMIIVYMMYSTSLLVFFVLTFGLLSILTLEIRTSKSHSWYFFVGLLLFLSIISCEVFSRFLSTYFSTFSSILSSLVFPDILLLLAGLAVFIDVHFFLDVIDFVDIPKHLSVKFMPVSYHFIDFFQLKIEQLFLKIKSDLFFGLMMKILVVAAMPNEIKAIKEGIKPAGIKVNLDIDYLCCGIGNYETISSLEHYLTVNSEPTFIWNIGICGYRNSKEEKKSDPIQVASIINLHTEKEMVIPPFLKIAPLKTCFCGENVILGKSEIENRNGIKDDEMYFDMESRGVEFIASKYKYPRLILKIPFDFIGGEKDVKVKNYNELTNKMNDILINLPYHDYLGKIILWIKQQ